MVSSSLEAGPVGALAAHADAHLERGPQPPGPGVVLTQDWQVVVRETDVVLACGLLSLTISRISVKSGEPRRPPLGSKLAPHAP